MAFDDKIEVSHAEKIIKGQVKVRKQLFGSTDSDFKILSVEPVNIEQGSVDIHPIFNTFVIKGNAPEIDFQDTYTIIAKEEHDDKYGKQYTITYIGTPMNFDEVANRNIFLKRILTERQFESMCKTLDDPFNAIADERIDLLTKCAGIGAKTALKLIDKYHQTIDYSEAYVGLDEYGLTPNMIEKLIDTYGSPNIAVQKVKANPYILATEVEGIGFKKADDIALASGMAYNSPFRISAFMEHYLNEQAQNGQSYMHPSELFGQLFEILSLERDSENNEIVKGVLYDLYEKDKLWYNENRTRISLKYIRDLEKKVAQEILRLINAKSNFNYSGWEKAIKKMEECQGWEFTEQQVLGIQTVLESQVTTITGKAGTGKSTVVTGMLEILNKKHGHTFGQCALSGRAGARLAEVTGEEGYTIHRLLGFSPFEGYFYNKNNPLPYDIIILDEISMVGLDMFYRLVSAIKDGGKLITMGDVSQLESIGIGNLAQDVIDSGVVSTVVLDKIHRQAQKSAIITESLKVSNGEQITRKSFNGKETKGELQDLELDIYDDKLETPKRIIKQFKEKLLQVKTIMDLQVIVPMKQRGDSSTFNLNNQLQKIYNPFNSFKKEVLVSLSKDKKYTLREGDKVINMKNNYKSCNVDGEDSPVFNGDIGIIREIDLEENLLIVEFQRIGDIIIDKANWKNLELAYAITVHKIQGSSSEITIVGLDYSSYVLLTKELVYTALTRASKLCVLVAENSALHHAIDTSNVSSKKTFLKEFLQNGLTG